MQSLGQNPFGSNQEMTLDFEKLNQQWEEQI